MKGTIFNFIMFVLLLSAAIFGARTAYNWIHGDNTWHLLKLSHTSAPVYVEEGYQDDISCIFAGDHYLSSDASGTNSYQCLRQCNSDHSICEGIIDSHSTASEMQKSEDYVKSLNLQ